MRELMPFILPWLPYLITGLVLWIGVVIVARLQKRTEKHWQNAERSFLHPLPAPGNSPVRPLIISSMTKSMIGNLCGDDDGASLGQITRLISDRTGRPVHFLDVWNVLDELEESKYLTRTNIPGYWIRSPWVRDMAESASLPVSKSFPNS